MAPVLLEFITRRAVEKYVRKAADVAGEFSVLQDPIKLLSRLANERLAKHLLLRTGGLSDEHDLGVVGA